MATNPKEIVNDAMERSAAIPEARKSLNLLRISISNRMRHGFVQRAAHRHLLNSVACCDPGIEPAVQRPDPIEAVFHQYFCDLSRRSFVGTGAVADYFPVARQVAQMLLHVGQRY